jgi:hypothetical protein
MRMSREDTVLVPVLTTMVYLFGCSSGVYILLTLQIPYVCTCTHARARAHTHTHTHTHTHIYIYISMVYNDSVYSMCVHVVLQTDDTVDLKTYRWNRAPSQVGERWQIEIHGAFSVLFKDAISYRGYIASVINLAS